MNQIKTLAFTALAALAGLAAAGQTPAGPWVYNGGVPVTPPVTAFAATAGQAANAVTANNGLPPFETSWMTNNITEWWSADTIGATNNQLLTSWTGHYGNSVTGNCIYVSQVPGSGHPGVWFDNSGSMVLSNATLLGMSYTNSGTIACVYTFPKSSLDLNNHVVFWAASGPGVNDFGYLADYNASPSFLNQPASLYWHLGGTLWNPYCSTYWGTHLFVFSWNSNASAVYIDGKAQATWPNGKAAPLGQGTPWVNGFSGTLTLGNITLGYGVSWPLEGYLSEFLFSSNSFSPPACDQMSDYFMFAKYGMPPDQIIVTGDSLPVGAFATWDGGWTEMLKTNYPGYQIINVAQGGSVAGESYTDALVTASSATSPGKRVGVCWFDNVNESNLGLNYITNQEIAFAQLMRSNNVPSVLVIPPSSFHGDTTIWGSQGLNSAYRAAMSNGWTHYFTAVANLAEDPNIGPSNSYSVGNPYFSTINDDHLTNGGYAVGFPYLQAAINFALNPANTVFLGSTNQPPPWQGPNWQCAQGGHVWYSMGSNFWTLIK
ncbi:MAG TPA: hypothetical protein VGY98_14895 [Verrucomicrobiae bacterium]|nr:hypothetical protein [Verrucomicrobiae bacterium]